MKEGFSEVCWYAEGNDPFGHASDFKGDTIAEARAWLLPRLRSGNVSGCPCCGQTVKLYARSINSGMVKALSVIARKGPVSPEGIGARGGDYGKLIYWGLVKKVGKFWVATHTGKLFLCGQVRVPKWMLVYDEVVRGASIRHMDVHEAYGSRFDFEELMQPATVLTATGAVT
jgi:hypothetical protein